MGLFESLKSLITRIEEIDEKSKNLKKNNIYSTNPFAPFTLKENETYVWVEKAKDNDSFNNNNSPEK